MVGVVASETPVPTPPTGDGGVEAPPSSRPGGGALRAPSLDTLFTALFALAGWLIGLRRLGDNSFLWHLRTGRVILDHGVPHHDIYSFSVPGTKWIAQSWLAELAYGIADKLAGGLGIRVLVAVTGALLVAATYRLALRLTANRVRAAALTTVVLATMMNVWSERPLVFGLAGVVALVWAIEVPESFLGRHLYVTIPAIMWCWANVHGSFSLGYVYLALHVAGRWADGAPPLEGRERQIVVATAISVAALVVNPYGFGLLWFPVDLVRRGDVLNGVAEWQSPNFRELGGMLYGLTIVVVVLALVRQARASRRDVIVALAFLFLGLWAVRNVGIAAIVTVPIAARGFAKPRVGRDDRSTLSWAFAMLLALVAVMQFNTAKAERDYDLAKYPVAAMQQMGDRGLLGERLFTTDAWAGYTIWRYWPQQHVYMDDRYDMYPKRVVDDYDTMANVEPKWRETLDRWRIDVVVWPTERSLSQALLERRDWERVYRDKTASVFVRR
jgi:hypothetical protein